MAIDFYNHNLHPITLYKKDQDKDRNKPNTYRGRINIGNNNFDTSKYIYSNDAMKLTGLKSNVLKKKIIESGGNVFIHFSRTAYLITDVKTIL